MNTKAGNFSSWVQESLFTRPAADYFNVLLELVDPAICIGEHRARVVAIKKHSSDVATIQLEVPGSWKGFTAGQYITVQFEIDGVNYKRNYSISSWVDLFEHHGRIEITVHRVNGGAVSGFVLDSLKENDVLGISEASGELVVPAGNTRPIVYLAGGSGITPITSIVLGRQFDAGKSVLIYSARKGQHIFRDTFQSIQDGDGGFRAVFHSTGSESVGRLDSATIAKHCPDIKDALVMICGSGEFVQSMLAAVEELGVMEGNILYEGFDAGRTTLDGQQGGRVQFSASGKESSGKETLLEQAESLGIPVKFGCRMGICHTCSCKKKSGVVVDARTGEASGADEEEIRLCVSVPQGPVELDL